MGGQSPAWIILLTAIGFSTSFAAALSITRDPTQAILVMILYGVVLGVLSFVTEVGHELRKRLVVYTANGIESAILALFSKHRHKYLRHLNYKNRTFDVKGLTTQGPYSLGLENVFVELTVAPQTPHDAAVNPIRLVPEQPIGRCPIWDYLKTKQHTHDLAIIGAPGSGKTTLLKHITLVLAGGWWSRRRFGAPNKLPILLFLRNHAKAIIESPQFKLTDAIQASLVGMNEQPPSEWFETRLQRCECLVMLDGLDEVADEKLRQKVVAWVDQQIVSYAGNRFIITSRPHGYRKNRIYTANVLEVLPFTANQVKRFVDNWYLANEIMSARKYDKGVQMAATEGAEDLLRRINNSSALIALAVNPLLLTMIANVHRFRSELPGRRVELYAEICEVFLGKWQAVRDVETTLTPAQKRRVLQPLAYHMMCTQKREISLTEALSVIYNALQLVSPQSDGKKFLKMVEDSSGLLLERENKVYSFAHLTFQEYLASVHIYEQGLIHKLTSQHVMDMGWWHETLRLFCARANATPVIQACLEGDPPTVAALVLAQECMEEALEVQPETRQWLENLVEGVEDSDSKRRRLAAEVMLVRRLGRMKRLNDDLYIDDSLITHAEYQLFLNEMGARGEYYHPDHWEECQFPMGLGKSPVVGVRVFDGQTFCDWLTARSIGKWQYRLPKAGEDERPLHKKIGYWTRQDGKTIFVYPSHSPTIISVEYLNRQRDEDLNRAQILAHSRNLDINFNRARTLDLDRERSHALDIDYIYNQTHNLALDLVNVLTFSLSFDPTLAFDRGLDLTFALALGYNINPNHTLELVFALALNDAFTLQEVYSVLRWYIRVLSLLVEDYVDLYIDMAILEARISQKLPVFEGIRIVRERVKK